MGNVRTPPTPTPSLLPTAIFRTKILHVFGLTRSGSYFQGVKSPKKQETLQEIRPSKDLSLRDACSKDERLPDHRHRNLKAFREHVRKYVTSRYATERCLWSFFLGYTQFAIQDSRLFGPNPWKILAPPSNYLSTKRFLGNPTLGTNLGSRILAMRTGCRDWGASVRLLRRDVPTETCFSPTDLILTKSKYLFARIKIRYR